MSGMIDCPRCAVKIPVNLTVCWNCGVYLADLHRKCGVCGKTVGHGKHRVDGVLVYVCGCGFTSKTREGLDIHQREVRGIC